MSIEVNNRPNVKISRPVATAEGGITDHGQLTGLADDDHPQYLNQGRGDARYALTVHAHDQYLVPAEVIAGTNVNVDSTTTPGSVIISAQGVISGGMVQSEWVWLASPQTGNLQSGRSGVDVDLVNDSTVLYIHRQDFPNIDWSYHIQQLDIGWHVYGQQIDDSSSWHRWEVTGSPTLVGDTWEIPVATAGGSPQGTEPDNNKHVIFGFEAPAIMDHGALDGLTDDDHPQYLNEARGDARYSLAGHTHAISDVTNLQTSLDDKATFTYVDDADTDLQTSINTKADTTYVDSQNSLMYTYIDDADTDLQTNINAKADLTYVNSQDTILQTAINDKADTTYVDSRIWTGDQTAYDALGTYDPEVLYVITP